MKTRMIAVLICATALTGCGLAETAATGAAAGAGAAEQAKEGKRVEEKVKTDIENIQKQEVEARAAAEAAATGGESE